MRCPACSRDLQLIAVDDITLDVCEGGCGGIWFDRFELSKFDEAHDRNGERLLAIRSDPSLIVDHERRRNCPRCADMVLARHLYSPLERVTVESCPGCAGIWLDAGELLQIRQRFTTEQDRKAAVSAYFDQTIGPELKKMRAEGEAGLQLAHRIARIFRFICPSYYIPGKQDWGAF